MFRVFLMRDSSGPKRTQAEPKLEAQDSRCRLVGLYFIGVVAILLSVAGIASCFIPGENPEAVWRNVSPSLWFSLGALSLSAFGRKLPLVFHRN
jgi:hypothetical protein